MPAVGIVKVLVCATTGHDTQRLRHIKNGAGKSIQSSLRFVFLLLSDLDESKSCERGLTSITLPDGQRYNYPIRSYATYIWSASKVLAPQK